MRFWNKWLWFLYGIIKGWLSPTGVAKFTYEVGKPENKKEAQIMALIVSCTTEQKVKITVHPVTLNGQPASLDGPIAVEVQSGDGNVQLLEDGLSFYVISGDAAGQTNYLVTGDADLGEGVVPVQDIVTLDVSFALAANLGLVAEAPEPK